MPDLSLDKLKTAISKRIKPFLEEILTKFSDKIHSIHITGTAITNDFDEKVSDVNSVIVLNKMDLTFLELLAPLGKKYKKQKVAAPLIMTPDYIKTSLDVFPIEFINFRLIHSTVYGEDILKNLEINRMDLRHQCERDLKTRQEDSDRGVRQFDYRIHPPFPWHYLSSRQRAPCPPGRCNQQPFRGIRH
jgi:hypothetical protein